MPLGHFLFSKFLLNTSVILKFMCSGDWEMHLQVIKLKLEIFLLTSLSSLAAFFRNSIPPTAGKRVETMFDPTKPRFFYLQPR